MERLDRSSDWRLRLGMLVGGDGKRLYVAFCFSIMRSSQSDEWEMP